MKPYEQVSFDESCWYVEQDNRREYPVRTRVVLHYTGDQRIDDMTGIVSGYYGDCWLIVTTDEPLPNGDLSFVIARHCVFKII